MGKKCIVCGEEAKYKIKDTSDYYCEDCAEENFSDHEMLVVLENEAQRLKEVMKEKLAPQEEDEEID